MLMRIPLAVATGDHPKEGLVITIVVTLWMLLVSPCLRLISGSALDPDHSHRSQACLGRSTPRRSSATYGQSSTDERTAQGGYVHIGKYPDFAELSFDHVPDVRGHLARGRLPSACADLFTRWLITSMLPSTQVLWLAIFGQRLWLVGQAGNQKQHTNEITDSWSDFLFADVIRL